MGSFGYALGSLRSGHVVRRRSWERGLSLVLLGRRFVVVAKCFGAKHRSEWIPTAASLLANDWEDVPEEDVAGRSS